MTLPVLAYFDKTKKHTIQCDASKKGLSAVLLQESKPVMHMSRALTETEQRYSNIERELLAIVFALERLNHYTFGRTIPVQSTISLTKHMEEVYSLSQPKTAEAFLDWHIMTST